LLALDGLIRTNAKKLGLSLVELDMKLYTYSTARQHLAEVLEEASREGEVQIPRHGARVSAVTPVAASGAVTLRQHHPAACQTCHVKRSLPRSTGSGMGTRCTRARPRRGSQPRSTYRERTMAAV
jgi:prevent-host-death family protein